MFYTVNRLYLVLFSVLLLASASFCLSPDTAAIEIDSDGKGHGINKIFVFDGSGIHDVGNLQIHTTNWGCFGSRPGSDWPTSNYPSAQWPANSSVEHMYISGLWVGARNGAISVVSTGAYETEFQPPRQVDDPNYLAVIYESQSNMPWNSRLPYPADDDGDGLVNEDPLDGKDNDGDGSSDEDFAGIGDQMFACWYTDDQESASNTYPEHVPLGLYVHQESYQWEDDLLKNAVGIKFTIKNAGRYTLEDVYLGFMVDGDVGPLWKSSFWADDQAGSWSGVKCDESGPVYIETAYMYDSDADGGQAPGYFGVVMLDQTTDPLGIDAPSGVGITSFQVIKGNESYQYGGDPENDTQRYALLSAGSFDSNTTTPDDYRILIGTGPYPQMEPGESLELVLAFVIGEGLEGFTSNAARFKCLYNGFWFDLDENLLTGFDRRETPVTGPASGVIIDECRAGLSEPISVWYGETVWINSDCWLESDFRDICQYDEMDSLIFRTGVAGRETQAHWYAQRPTATLLQSFDASADDNGIKLKWKLSSIDNGSVFRVNRKSEEDAGFINVNTIPGTERLSYGYTDRSCERGVPYRYRVEVINAAGAEILFETNQVIMVPPSFTLGQNKPNPFNPSTAISYSIKERSPVTLDIYDPGGRKIINLVNCVQCSGDYRVSWKGCNSAGEEVPSGIYLYRLKTGKNSITRKMVVLR